MYFFALTTFGIVVSFLERFSFECRKVIGFAFTTLRDWFKKLAPLFHPIRSKTKTNRDSLARVFPHFASATCNYLVFWLVHLIICVLCDWLAWLLWFWFYDTQLKTALLPDTKICLRQARSHTFYNKISQPGHCLFKTDLYIQVNTLYHSVCTFLFIHACTGTQIANDTSRTKLHAI